MRALKNEYQKPQVIKQGSAITKTAARVQGMCYDGHPTGDDVCLCSGHGSDCKPG